MADDARRPKRRDDEEAPDEEIPAPPPPPIALRGPIQEGHSYGRSSSSGKAEPTEEKESKE